MKEWLKISPFLVSSAIHNGSKEVKGRVGGNVIFLAVEDTGVSS